MPEGLVGGTGRPGVSPSSVAAPAGQSSRPPSVPRRQRRGTRASCCAQVDGGAVRECTCDRCSSAELGVSSLPGSSTCARKRCCSSGCRRMRRFLSMTQRAVRFDAVHLEVPRSVFAERVGQRQFRACGRAAGQTRAWPCTCSSATAPPRAADRARAPGRAPRRSRRGASSSARRWRARSAMTSVAASRMRSASS